MEEDMIMEESPGTEAGESGGLTLNGEAWKNKNNTTYTSLLDRYEAADLFSDKNMELYRELGEEQHKERQELTEYIFSGEMQSENEEEALTDLIFAEEIKLSRVRDYSRKEEDYSVCFVMAEILFVFVFLLVMMKISAGRRKRREADAAKVNMESEGAAGYGFAGL